MRFQDKLKENKREELWDEYCGFLDLKVDDFMVIQNRLLMEQISLWSGCQLGQRILKGKVPRSAEEFREMAPLTTYEDYAEVLLQKQNHMLPAEPVLWLQTTWEGGMNPVKVAPYTKSMLDTYRSNMVACLMLSTSQGRGQFDVSQTDNILYALAPLPYATGIFPVLMQDEIDIGFLPPVKEAVHMTFSERNKKGFKMGLKHGIDFFFGLGSVTYFVSLSIASMQGSGKGGRSLRETLGSISPRMLVRMLMAKKTCREENRQLEPRDLFQLKGFMCAGTDNGCYKDDLERLWGIRPMEIFAGTEPTCIGTETWTRNGMYFFPDACYYEFIPEVEMEKNLADPDYKPKTILMDEVKPGEKYELVITVLKGGVFARYRVGDMYRCAGLASKEDQTQMPRFHYVDRVPTIIDIAGFTRISENSVKSAVMLSGLSIEEWIALKEYNEEGRPMLHLYMEMSKDALITGGVSCRIIKDHLSIYFKYLDQDYKDLKKILGMDPLKVTLLRCGTFASYKEKYGALPRHMNPSGLEVTQLLKESSTEFRSGRGGVNYV